MIRISRNFKIEAKVLIIKKDGRFDGGKKFTDWKEWSLSNGSLPSMDIAKVRNTRV